MIGESIQEPEVPQTGDDAVDVDEETLQMTGSVLQTRSLIGIFVGMHSRPKPALFYAIGSFVSVTADITKSIAMLEVAI